MFAMNASIISLFIVVFIFFITINYEGGTKFIKFQALLFISSMILTGVIIGLIIGS